MLEETFKIMVPKETYYDRPSDLSHPGLDLTFCSFNFEKEFHRRYSSPFRTVSTYLELTDQQLT